MATTTKTQGGVARIGSQVRCGPLGPITTNLDKRVAPRGPQEIPAVTIYYIQPNFGGETSSGDVNFVVPYGYYS